VEVKLDLRVSEFGDAGIGRFVYLIQLITNREWVCVSNSATFPTVDHRWCTL